MSNTTKSGALDRLSLGAISICNARRNLWHLAAVISIYIGCSWIAAPRMWWLKVAVWLLRAVVLVGVTSIIHECIHGLFARAKWVNRWIGAIAAAVLLKNYTLHRAFHLRHHSRTTKDDDPEPKVQLRSIRDYLRLVSRRGNILFTTRTSWHGTWSALRGSPPDYLSSKELPNVRMDALVEFLWLAAVLGGLIFFPRQVIDGYLIPLCISPLLAFFVFLPEHYATTTGSGRAVENTRTIRSNAVFRFLFWNNNYHAEHHAFPGVPFFNLHRLHRLMAGQISHTAGSYTRFHLDLLRQLRVGSPVAAAGEKHFIS